MISFSVLSRKTNVLNISKLAQSPMPAPLLPAAAPKPSLKRLMVTLKALPNQMYQTKCHTTEN
jgi:hypothetical protein